jgi:hypothetical protein
MADSPVGIVFTPDDAFPHPISVPSLFIAREFELFAAIFVAVNGPIPVKVAEELPFVVGVPEISPLVPFNDNPAGKPLPLAKAHELIVPVKAGV